MSDDAAHRRGAVDGTALAAGKFLLGSSELEFLMIVTFVLKINAGQVVFEEQQKGAFTLAAAVPLPLSPVAP